MNHDEAKDRVRQLTDEINHHNYLYYVKAEPVLSDYDFDMLLEELIRLEKSFPDLALPDSPTQRVGGEVTREFTAV